MSASEDAGPGGLPSQKGHSLQIEARLFLPCAHGHALSHRSPAQESSTPQSSTQLEAFMTELADSDNATEWLALFDHADNHPLDLEQLLDTQSPLDCAHTNTLSQKVAETVELCVMVR